MTTADWALIISLGSLLVAVSAFVWNVWSKFIYPKPKIDVSFNVMTTFGGTGNDTNMFVLTVTNFGPVANHIKMAIAREPPRGLRRRRQMGILSPLHDFPAKENHSLGPFSGGLPKKLDVGEEFSLYFPFVADAHLGSMERVGVVDTFGRNHWCSKKHMRRAHERFKSEFGVTSGANSGGAILNS